MAELVDALVSGTSGRKVVGVRVPFWAFFVALFPPVVVAEDLADVSSAAAFGA